MGSNPMLAAISPVKFMVNDKAYTLGSGRLPHGPGSIPGAGTILYLGLIISDGFADDIRYERKLVSSAVVLSGLLPAPDLTRRRTVRVTFLAVDSNGLEACPTSKHNSVRLAGQPPFWVGNTSGGVFAF